MAIFDPAIFDPAIFDTGPAEVVVIGYPDTGHAISTAPPSGSAGEDY